MFDNNNKIMYLKIKKIDFIELKYIFFLKQNVEEKIDIDYNKLFNSLFD